MRVAVTGPCASGKTTLVANLNAHGVEAVAVAQEHSEIENLWQRSKPDVLVLLTVDLETVRDRRGSSWSEHLFETQLRRLAHARQHADLQLDTAVLSPEDALQQTLDHLQKRDPQS